MMKFKSIGLCLCVALSLSAQAADSGERTQVLPRPAERIAELASQVRRAQWGEAIQAGERLLAQPGQLAERQRGEVHFATALARAMQERQTAGNPALAAAPVMPAAPLPGHANAPGLLPTQPPSPEPILGAGYLAASEDFETSRALAGPGELRLSATYDLGTTALLRGELWRLEIPEVAQAAGQQAPGTPPGMNPAPTAPGASGAQGASEAEAPDPLEQARSAYREAKQHLILRLRSDWRDADTRANLEWIQRRLRELKEIEEQRKQEEQEQDGEDGEDGEEGEDGEDGEPGEDGEEQDPKDPGEEGEEGEESPEDQESGEDPESEEQEEQEAQPEEERPDSQADGGEAQSSKQKPAERVLTREEVIRLLDKLADLEAEAQELKDAQAKSQTVRVDRDW